MMMRLKEIKNPLLRSFLADVENYQLYKEFCNEPSDCKRATLEEKFNSFYTKVRTLSYFSKTIRFTAQHYDKKLRLLNNMYLLILDGTTHYESNESSQTLKDLIEDKRVEDDYQSLNVTLEDFIQDKSLYEAINTLTEKQKRILYLAFINELSDTEISKTLHVTQQAITKAKNNALKKVRRIVNV